MMTSAAAGGERRRSQSSRLVDGEERFEAQRLPRASEDWRGQPARAPAGRSYGFSVIRIL